MPVGLTPLASFVANHWGGKPVIAVKRLVAKAVAVGNPALVNRLVLKRYNPKNPARLGLHNQVGAKTIVGANAAPAAKLPCAGGITERLAG